MSSYRLICSKLAAAPMFMIGGINLALSVGWNNFPSVEYTSHYSVSWFIGILLGALVSSAFIARSPIRVLLVANSLIAVLAGILTVSLAFNNTAVLLSRYMNGYAVGGVTVAYIAGTSELYSQKSRGCWLSVEQFSIALGIFIAVIFEVNWSYSSISVIQIFGIIYVALALLSLTAGFVYFESPIFHLRRNNLHAAEETISIMLRSEPNAIVLKAETLVQLQEYVDYNNNKSLAVKLTISVLPLIKLMLFRSLVALTFAGPLNVNVQLIGFIVDLRMNLAVTIFYAAFRVLGSGCRFLYVSEIWGRKFITLLSLLLMGVMACVIAALAEKINIYSLLYRTNSLTAMCGIFIVFELFAGLFTPSTTIYLAEAFPLHLKPYLIALCITVEQIIYIIVIALYYNSFSVLSMYCYMLFGIFLVSIAVIGVAFPETRNTTLLEAQILFQKVLNLRFRS